MLFPKNLGPHLNLDEVAVTNGELLTMLTNKAAHGKKGALVAMIQAPRPAILLKCSTNSLTKRGTPSPK